MAQDHVITKLRELARQILLYQSFYFCLLIVGESLLYDRQSKRVFILKLFYLVVDRHLPRVLEM